MTGRVREWGLWCFGCIAMLGAARTWHLSGVVFPVPTPVVPTDGRAEAWPDSDTLDSLVDEIQSRDPFRLARTPAAAPFDARADLALLSRTADPRIGSAPPSPVRPQFVLHAIMGGPPWQAVLEGLPGTSGNIVVRQGDVFARFTVRSIGRDTVVVQASDTTYRLTLGRSP